MTEERKQSLGEFLKSERERRGLTIEQTSSATKIGLKILKQLESDRYSELPALPFVRGFVRNYAKFLGLDSEKLLAEYASFLDVHSRERPKRDVGHSGYAFERPEGEQSKKILWGVMAAMLVFGGAVVFVFKPSLKRKHHGHVDKLRPSAGPSPLASESPTPIPSVSALASPIPSAVPSVVSSPVPSPTPSPTPTHSPEPPFVPPAIPLVLAPPTPVVASPSPSPSPIAVKTPSPTPVVTHSPVPSPTPAVTTAASPVPSPSPAATADVVGDRAEDLKKDPLQSGTNYKPNEVKYKLIFRTKADVWVRYQCDDKKMMRFALREGKILVLRGKGSVRFQVSNPASVTFQLSGGPERILSETPEMFEYAGNATLVFPAQDREKISELFKVGSPLPHTDSPQPPVVNGSG